MQTDLETHYSSSVDQKQMKHVCVCVCVCVCVFVNILSSQHMWRVCRGYEERLQGQ